MGLLPPGVQEQHGRGQRQKGGDDVHVADGAKVRTGTAHLIRGGIKGPVVGVELQRIGSQQLQTADGDKDDQRPKKHLEYLVAHSAPAGNDQKQQHIEADGQGRLVGLGVVPGVSVLYRGKGRRKQGAAQKDQRADLRRRQAGELSRLALPDETVDAQHQKRQRQNIDHHEFGLPNIRVALKACKQQVDRDKHAAPDLNAVGPLSCDSTILCHEAASRSVDLGSS